MNKQNKILDVEDILNTYKTKIPIKQLKVILSRKWFPITSQILEEVAYLIGKVMGDGNLDKNYIARFIGQEKDLTLLKELIITIFNIESSKLKIRRKEAKGVSYLLQINDTLFGRLLASLGTPVGNKTKIAFGIPSWITKDKSYSKRFLQALLEDELSTIKIEKSSYSVKPRLKLAKEDRLIPNLRLFLTQIKLMLGQFNVKCSNISNHATFKQGQTTRELYLDINRNKENILTFAREIGFRINAYKIKCLNNTIPLLENTKQNRKPFIDKEKIIALRKKSLTIRQISKIVKLNPTSVHRVIIKNKKKCGGRDLNSSS